MAAAVWRVSDSGGDPAPSTRDSATAIEMTDITSAVCLSRDREGGSAGKDGAPAARLPERYRRYG